MRSTAVFVAALVAACATTAPPQPSAQPSAPQAAAVAPPNAQHARELLAAGQPRDALTEIDELARAHRGDASLWLLRGEACLATARNDSEPQFYYADALNAFERARQLGAGREALFGASRAARLKLEPERALDYAHQAVEGVAQLDAEQARIAIEAAFDCYILKKQTGGDASELYHETESRVLDLLAREPDDAWALLTLANLFEWNGHPEAAVEPLAHLVEVQPADEGAHNRLATVLRATEGSEGILAFYESFRARHPTSGLGEWYVAQELFEQALAALYAQQDSSAKFARAEELFASCRELAPNYAKSCLGYEVMCRDGIGWCRFNAGDLDGAEREFLAMEELLPGGLQWQIEGRLLSGVAGLELIADRALKQGAGNDDSDASGTAKAAAIYARLRGLCPSDASIANNCGFFHREVGVAHLAGGRKLAADALAEKDAGAKAGLEGRSQSELASAKKALLASRDAYLAAAGLADRDVRIVNDAALILVYHFPSRADDAEQLLMHAVELGREQKDDPALSDEARDALLEAWGDAHQNLGVLYLLHRRDPAKAREWFQQSIDIGPRPRVDRRWISDVALPLCERAAAGQPLDPLALDPRIGSVE